MKSLLVLSAVCVLALAQREGEFERLVAEDVRAIIQAHPTITRTSYINRCDARIDQDDPLEKEITDRYCASECRQHLEGSTILP